MRLFPVFRLSARIIISLALVLAAASARADRPAADPVRFSACSVSQREALLKAHGRVAGRVRELLHGSPNIGDYRLSGILHHHVLPAGLEPAPFYLHPEKTYAQFHRKVWDALIAMEAKLKKGFTYQCLSVRVANCRPDRGVEAFVRFLFKRPLNFIYLCPAFFQSTERGFEETLMHELSHLAADTDHYFGTFRTDEGILKSAEDAFFYQRLMHQELASVLKVHSWGLMWRRSGLSLSRAP